MYGAPMFLEHLLAALRNPHSQLFQLDDELPFDADRYRALLSAETWRRGQQGELDEATAAWVFRCIADGWVDEHLSDIRDALLELLAVRDADHLDALLCRATEQILGASPRPQCIADEEAPLLTPADHHLLRTTTQAVTKEQVPRLGARLLARRYAIQLGLLSKQSGTWQRTCLGDAVIELPRIYAWPLLLSLETLQALDPYDRWRVSESALLAMRDRGTFVVRTADFDGDSESGLFPWQRIRRLHRLGLLEPVPQHLSGHETQCEFPFRLTQVAQDAVERVLRTPEHEVMRLAQTLLQERTDDMMQPYRLRQRGIEAVRHSDVIEHAPPSFARQSMVVCDDEAAGLHADSGPLLRMTDLSVSPLRMSEDRAEVPQMDEEREAVPEPTRPGSGGDRGPQEIDLGPLIRRAWGDLQERRVHFSLLGPTTQVFGERRLLVQTLREILRGAAASAQHGSHSLALVTVELAPQDDHVVLFVHDNGIGPPLPALPSLLEMTDDELAEPAETEGDVPSLQRQQQSLWGIGGELTLLAPRLGGTSLRIILPRNMEDQRSAA